MSIDVYKSALEQAKKDLTEVTREFESARTRKELMEKLFDALTQLTLYLNPVEEPQQRRRTPLTKFPRLGQRRKAWKRPSTKFPKLGYRRKLLFRKFPQLKRRRRLSKRSLTKLQQLRRRRRLCTEVAATEAREGAEAAEDEVQVLQEG